MIVKENVVGTKLNNNFSPQTSVIVPAYNEDKKIQKRMENLLTLEYPANKLEIIIASDCSTNRTVKLGW